MKTKIVKVGEYEVMWHEQEDMPGLFLGMVLGSDKLCIGGAEALIEEDGTSEGISAMLVRKCLEP